MAGRQRAPSALHTSDLRLIVAGAAVFLLVLGALTGVGVASLLFGGGWVWPRGVAGAVREFGSLLTGEPAGGLDGASVHRLPAAGAVWVCVAIFELVAVGFVVLIARVIAQGRAPARSPASVATRAEAAAALGRSRRRASDPAWLLGRSEHLRGVDLWVPFGRTVGVLGPAAPDVVANAALAAPGALLQIAVEPDDVLLTLPRRSESDRPIAVCDPFEQLPGLPPLIWDPLSGCVEPAVAARRAQAFAAGTVREAASANGDAVAARRQAGDAAKVLQCYFHAAALTGRTLDDVMEWVADPLGDDTAAAILAQHPHAEPHWAGLLRGALRQSVGAVATTQQVMALFLRRDVVRRCVAGHGQRGADLADLIARGGTIYLVGKGDSTSPLVTAIADDVLAMPAGSPLTAVIDDLPSTAPVPSLRRRLAGMVWTARSRDDLATCYGVDGARAITEATDVIVQPGGGGAVVQAGTSAPIGVRLRRVERAVLAERDEARARIAEYRARQPAPRDLSRAALNAARDHGLHVDSGDTAVIPGS